ncbi:Bug family tripartite tricarboxylate transporter substrate binding protein [Variovorax sp. PBL-E5]|uniref:Bug family tripartite tricarboxylate transporter substrate binding protein n=1 Tax=Variovorax sp. PBL-E5 TaxID=434014 RepID=UPI001318388E|nr:tripartite tricarboxylate transporter substrate binding protein [Variovorax sp. PBL-E5]VTU46004.1 Argininosuccinate lyase [Variovorax sp. PBL-E5]
MLNFNARRLALALPVIALSMALFGAMPATAAGEFPTKRITMLVGYPPGGTADRTARVLGEMMGKDLGQPVIVENKSGASQTIAGTALLAAEPDGHTMLVVAEIDFVSAVVTAKGLAYKLSDFKTVCGTATTPYLGLVVKADSRFKTVDDVVAEAKAKPGSLSWGTAGLGTGHFWTMELFRREAGVEILHVPYQGGGPAITALLGGQVDLMGGSYALWRPQLQAGKVRVLLIQGPNRLADLPGIPSYKDKGWLPALKQGWMRVLVSKRTPDAVVERLSKSCELIKTDAHAQKILRDGGAEPVFFSAAEATKLAQEDENEIIPLAKTAQMQ